MEGIVGTDSWLNGGSDRKKGGCQQGDCETDFLSRLATERRDRELSLDVKDAALSCVMSCR